MNELHSVCMIGIGGIGMSAIARYFNSKNIQVFGYDKTPTKITDSLTHEGVKIIFEDNVAWVKEIEKDHNTNNLLVVYTPAIPSGLKILNHFLQSDVTCMKRSKILGILTEGTRNLSIAGTHGKTTTSCMLAHILASANIPEVAFLGGIAANYETNYLNTSDNHTEFYSVTEADEYDRSFLTLYPHIAAITSMDADHLDIYGKPESLNESFIAFGNQVSEQGKLFVHHSFQHHFTRPITTYGIGVGQVCAQNVHIHQGDYIFDLYYNVDVIRNIKLGIPGNHNVENAVAASAIALEIGISQKDLVKALSSFRGVKRRFQYIIKSTSNVYIDDYAHHPTELHAIIQSCKHLYPQKKITAIFQPHLYSRTRDFMDAFAAELSQLDEVILLDIYPARELPIEGVTSDTLLKLISTNKQLLSKENTLKYISGTSPEVLLTLGAGDIDSLVEPLTQILTTT